MGGLGASPTQGTRVAPNQHQSGVKLGSVAESEHQAFNNAVQVTALWFMLTSRGGLIGGTEGAAVRRINRAWASFVSSLVDLTVSPNHLRQPSFNHYSTWRFRLLQGETFVVD